MAEQKIVIQQCSDCKTVMGASTLSDEDEVCVIQGSCLRCMEWELKHSDEPVLEYTATTDDLSDSQRKKWQNLRGEGERGL